MNIAGIAKIDQLIPISKARDSLSGLVDEVSKKDFFVLVKKYKPKAALVDLNFLDKLLRVYYRFRREQDFAGLDKLRRMIPVYQANEVEKDIKNALKEIRKAA